MSAQRSHRGDRSPGHRATVQAVVHPINTRTVNTMTETWLTYAELAERLGTTPEAARAKANRGRWRKQLDNTGKAKVLVDLDAQPPRTRSPGRTPDHRPDARSDTQAAVVALESHVDTLKEQLAKAEAMALDRGREIAVERERVADLTAQLLRITAELLEARKADTARRRSWWQRLVG